jgi:hypothetical protein
VKRLLFSLLMLAVAASAVRAHFVWLLPSVPDGNKVGIKVVFSDKLAPDDPKYLEKIKQTELFVLAPDKKPARLKMMQGQEAWESEMEGQGLQAVGARCDYGVVNRGGAEFALRYYAKAIVIPAHLEPSAEVLDTMKKLTSDVLALDVVPVKDGVMVRWQGKPLADAEVVIIGDGEGEPIEKKTDKHGVVSINHEDAQKAGVKGLLGVRAKFVEAKEGTEDGKAYKEVRHYATLTLRIPSKAGQPVNDPAKGPAVKEDPAATKLLAEARAARAQYVHFPGFTADIDINLDGKVHKGKVEVTNTGKVTVTAADGDKDAEAWARGQLSSTVGHRLDDSTSLNTPCGFADEDEHHPLGRAIKVLNDEFHSSYRVRDKQIIVVNRGMKDSRFTITVMENYTTEEGKFIPATYTVNTWDLKTEALKSSQSHHHTWKRVGKFDLPETLTVVTATDGKLEAMGLTLSHFALPK